MARGTVGVILALTLAVALLLPPHHSLAPPGMISGARAATLRLPHRWLSAPENLLTNGDFSAGTSGWSALSGTLAAVNGGLRLTTTAGFGLACQAVAVVPGASYRATALAYRVSGGTGARIQIKTNECDGSILVSADIHALAWWPGDAQPTAAQIVAISAAVAAL